MMKRTQPIQVYCRLKPALTKNEKLIKYEIKKINGQEIICFNFKKYEQFQFQNVFNENTTQSSIFEHVAVPILDRFLHGMNGTIFTYGQTGSGKTHTIVGSEYDKGIIPRSFQYIFTKNAALKSPEENEKISVSYFEVYNEDIYDLIPLNNSSGHNKNMQSTKRVKFMVNVIGEIDFKNLNVVRVNNVKEAFEILKSGNKNRRIISTTTNDRSSRSHCICKITYLNKGSESILNLVDLAGSERASKTSNIDKKTITESHYINISLLYLHQVINTLSNGISQKHVPYRNSIITLLLKGSLGFKCATALISTIVLNYRSIAESVSTLRYAKDVTGLKSIIKEPKRSVRKRSLKLSKTKIKLVSTSQYTDHPSRVKNTVKTERYVELSETIQKPASTTRNDEYVSELKNIIVEPERSLLKGSLKMPETINDLERTSQYSEDGSGKKNIVRTERSLYELYAELSEKLKNIGHDIIDIKQLQTDYLNRDDVMIPPRVMESGDGTSDNLKTTKDVLISANISLAVGDDRLAKSCQTMDVVANSNYRAAGSRVGDLTNTSKRCRRRVISDYRNYCILLIIISNIIFMRMWSKEQEINTVPLYNSDLKCVKTNSMIDYRPNANSINNYIIVSIIIVLALCKFRLTRIRTEYDDFSINDSSILHTPTSIKPVFSYLPAVHNCEQESRGINRPKLQDTTCPCLTPESVDVKYIADGYGIWRRNIVPTPTSIKPLSSCLTSMDKCLHAEMCKKSLGLQDAACTCFLCDYQCHLNVLNH